MLRVHSIPVLFMSFLSSIFNSVFIQCLTHIFFGVFYFYFNTNLEAAREYAGIITCMNVCVSCTNKILAMPRVQFLIRCMVCAIHKVYIFLSLYSAFCNYVRSLHDRDNVCRSLEYVYCNE